MIRSILSSNFKLLKTTSLIYTTIRPKAFKCSNNNNKQQNFKNNNSILFSNKNGAYKMNYQIRSFSSKNDGNDNNNNNNNNNNDSNNEGGYSDNKIQGFIYESLLFVHKNPNEPKGYGVLAMIMSKLEILSIKLLNGETLTFIEAMTKEIENNPSSLQFFIPYIAFYLNGFIKETAIINGKEYSKHELMLWALDIDETNQIALDYVDKHLYVTGKPSITLLNGKELTVDSKFGKFISKPHTPKNKFEDLKPLIDLIEESCYNKIDLPLNKFMDLSLCLRMFVFLIGKNEKIPIFDEQMDRLEISMKMVEAFPKLPFIYTLIVNIMMETGNMDSITLPNGKIVEFRQLFIMDLENVNQEYFDSQIYFDHEHPTQSNEILKIIYEILCSTLEGLTTMMKGFTSQVVINGELTSKLDLLLKGWEIANANQLDFHRYSIENILLTYLEQVGKTILQLPNGSTLKYDITSSKFVLL